MAINFKPDFSNVDPNDVSSWPTALKIIVIIAVCVAVVAGGYYLDTADQLAQYEAQQKKEDDLKNSFKVKQNKAVNLPLYKEQMEEMKNSFGEMLRQLPSKTEVAELLVDVSQKGLANGLEFELFRPKDEVSAEFYSELPIQIKVKGNYHDFGKFVSDVAALPRIVTIQDIVITPLNVKGGATTGKLSMEATAKTFRYLDDEET